MCLVCMAFECWSSFEMSHVTCVWFVWHSSVGLVSKCHMCLVCMAFECWSSFEMSHVTCVWFVWHSSVGQVLKCCYRVLRSDSNKSSL